MFTCCCSAYVECIDGGIFEWNTVTDQLVHFFANVTGYLTASLGDDWILASDAASNLVTMLLPQRKRITPVLASFHVQESWIGCIYFAFAVSCC